jgi:hypothetical protein
MRLWIWATALCAISLLAGCGGDGKGAGDAEARVRQWLPRADQVRCTSPRKQVTSCEVSVRKRPVGTEHWHCRFEDFRDGAASAGSYACWTEDGSQDSLGKAARLD